MSPSTTTKTRKIMSLFGPSVEDLPVQCMIDILSRLPVKTIIHCRCVCKKWLDLVSDSYFANLHLSRSPAILMIHHKEITGHSVPGILKWVEVENELGHHHLHHDPVMSLDLNLVPIFQKSLMISVGSVNGSICFRNYKNDDISICNPITREYMILHRKQYDTEGTSIAVYCFGIGSLTGEYKVIRIFKGNIPSDSISTFLPNLSEAEVYTLGTGRWRNLGRVPYSLNGIYGTFLNGHVYWNVRDKHSPENLYAFDFDKETFNLFPSPPSEAATEESLGVLKGCLCRCDTYSSKFTVWVMKEYGIKKSWHKELVIERSIGPNLDLLALKRVYLVEGLKDGTILMSSYGNNLFVYCPRRKTSLDTEIFCCYFRGFVHRPSFHRLQNFENERVHMF